MILLIQGGHTFELHHSRRMLLLVIAWVEGGDSIGYSFYAALHSSAGIGMLGGLWRNAAQSEWRLCGVTSNSMPGPSMFNPRYPNHCDPQLGATPGVPLFSTLSSFFCQVAVASHRQRNGRDGGNSSSPPCFLYMDGARSAATCPSRCKIPRCICVRRHLATLLLGMVILVGLQKTSYQRVLRL